MEVVVTGPRERGITPPGALVVDTTSRSSQSWSRAFSPFYLGPIELYGGHVARTMENAWQYSKVYPDLLDINGDPSDAYWSWANQGWAATSAERYPRGKGAKPSYCWWNGAKLGYIDARSKVYFKLYRDAVLKTEAFTQLTMMAKERTIVLWDFDGYDETALDMTLADVLLNEQRPMGHAFVLKAMIQYGHDVTPAMIMENCKLRPPAPEQLYLL